MAADQHFNRELNRWRLLFFRSVAFVTIVLTGILLISRRSDGDPSKMKDLVLFTMALVFIGLLVFVRKGYKPVAGVIFIFSALLTLGYTSYSGQGVFDSSVFALIAVLLFSAFLLDYRITMIVLTLSLVWVWIMVRLHGQGFFVEAKSDSPFIYAREITITLILVSTGGYLFIRQINKYISQLASELHEKSQMEIVLRKSESKYRALFDQAVEGILIGNDEGAILLANQGMEFLTGYTKKELQGKNIDILFSEAQQKSEPLRYDLLERGQTVMRTRDILRKDGTSLTIEMRTKKLEDGRLQALFVDVTERIRAQQSLRDFERIFKMSANPICLSDINGRLLKVNPAFSSKLGYKIEEIEGKNIFDFIYEKDKAGTLKFIEEQVAAKSDILRFENRYVTSEGKIVWFSWTTQADYEGGVGFSIAHDISALKRFERELIAAKEKAEESDRLKSAFLANMSHEIRTPMNSIIGFSEMFLSSDLEDDDRIKYAGIVHNSGKKLMRVLDDILDISRIETGKIEFKFEPVSINDLCQEIYELHEADADRKNLDFRFNCSLEDEKSNIITDKVRLTQVLDNLVSNAIKFTKSGHVRFGYQTKEGYIEFFIEDTGIGIQPDEKELIFDRFKQANASISKEYGGTGLGLAISRRLIQMMGGEIYLTSEPGKGSTFYFTILLRKWKAERIPDSEAEPGSVSGEHLILVVEDEPANSEYLAAVLKKQGMQTLHAENGVEAIEMIRENSAIEMVFMDIKMPLMNGFDATRAIKKLKPDLPVIMQTAYAMQTDQEKAMQAGCDDFVAKPIVQGVLRNILQRYLVKKP